MSFDFFLWHFELKTWNSLFWQWKWIPKMSWWGNISVYMLTVLFCEHVERIVLLVQFTKLVYQKYYWKYFRFFMPTPQTICTMTAKTRHSSVGVALLRSKILVTHFVLRPYTCCGCIINKKTPQNSISFNFFSVALWTENLIFAVLTVVLTEKYLADAKYFLICLTLILWTCARTCALGPFYQTWLSQVVWEIYEIINAYPHKNCAPRRKDASHFRGYSSFTIKDLTVKFCFKTVHML